MTVACKIHIRSTAQAFNASMVERTIVDLDNRNTTKYESYELLTRNRAVTEATISSLLVSKNKEYRGPSQRKVCDSNRLTA